MGKRILQIVNKVSMDRCSQAGPLGARTLTAMCCTRSWALVLCC